MSLFRRLKWHLERKKKKTEWKELQSSYNDNKVITNIRIEFFDPWWWIFISPTFPSFDKFHLLDFSDNSFSISVLTAIPSNPSFQTLSGKLLASATFHSLNFYRRQPRFCFTERRNLCRREASPGGREEYPTSLSRRKPISIDTTILSVALRELYSSLKAR